MLKALCTVLFCLLASSMIHAESELLTGGILIMGFTCAVHAIHSRK